MGLGILAGQDGSDGDALGAATWGLSGRVQNVWSQSGPKPGPGEPSLTPSMRTLGDEVVRGRWGRSLSGGSLSRSFSACGVAVLLSCTGFARVWPQCVDRSGQHGWQSFAVCGGAPSAIIKR